MQLEVKYQSVFNPDHTRSTSRSYSGCPVAESVSPRRTVSGGSRRQPSTRIWLAISSGR